MASELAERTMAMRLRSPTLRLVSSPVQWARILECVECGIRSDPSRRRERGWRGYRCDDPEAGEAPALAFYCPTCARNQFSSETPKA